MKLLLVEDDIEISTMLKEFLATENFEVTCAGDGESACRLFDGGHYDLVLLDLAAQYTIDSSQFYSMGKSTPFDGWHVTGKVVRTIYRGQTVYVEE